MFRTITTATGIVLLSLFCTSAARAVIAPTDIQAWYGLNGDALDNSANGYHGVNNGASFASDPVRGLVGAFNGTTSSVDISASGYSITESPNLHFATSFWIKPTARDDRTPGGAIDFNTIMGANTGGGVIEIVGEGSWPGMGSVNGSIGVNSGGGAGSVAIVPTIDLYDGNWHHVLMQWVDPDGSVAGGTGADATIYVDGVLATDSNSQTYNGNGGAAPTMVLGGPVVGSQGGPADDYYQGLLSDVIFYNRQLMPGEVSEAMALSAAGPVIPEPSTLVLAALALLGLAFHGLRRRRPTIG